MFLFPWEPLDSEGFGTYGLHQMILLALGKLREDPKLRVQAFTVLAGDHGPNLSHLAIGYAPSDLDLARYFLKHWKKPYMDGPVHRDMSSLMPVYRYDHGPYHRVQPGAGTGNRTRRRRGRLRDRADALRPRV